MKKSILLGALAIFAISAMSIQSVEAQNPGKKKAAATELKESKKPAEATTVKEPKTKQVTSEDCCGHKNGTCPKKLGTAKGKKPNSMVKPQPKKGAQKAAQTNTKDK